MVLHLTQGKVFHLDERLSVNEKSLAGVKLTSRELRWTSWIPSSRSRA
jgi:hypothetical protein